VSGTSARLNYETYARWMIYDLSRTASLTTLFADISSVQHKKAKIQQMSYHTNLRPTTPMTNLNLKKNVSKNPEY
jgi:hypothetical protein